MALSQSLSQAQLQKLSPQQIQGIKLLELPTIQLEARIAKEIEENPVLEQETKTEDSEQSVDTASIEDYIKSEAGSNSYRLRANNSSADDERRTPQIHEGKSLADFLTEQLSFYDLTDRERSIAQFIIGTIDDDGYLRRTTSAIADDIAFKLSLEVSDGEVEQVISIIQQLDPAGIAARNLSECLLLQLNHLRSKTPSVRLAERILRDFFTEFSKKHYAAIMQRTGATEEQLRNAIEDIISLNPKPANGYADESIVAIPTIIPDFTLSYNDEEGEFDLQLAGRPIPELKINREYFNMAQKALDAGQNTQSDRDAVQFVKSKIDAAKWFISAIKQRQNTLMRTMRAILDFQKDYFVDGDQGMLRPMILKDIAQKTGFDISTISRVVNSKYIQTHFGTYLLKYFFSEGLSTDGGEEVSTREIKRIIAECIDAESKQDPLTDEALMTTLHDRGFQIARRTVAKYREMLGIPVARLRREL